MGSHFHCRHWWEDTVCLLPFPVPPYHKQRKSPYIHEKFKNFRQHTILTCLTLTNLVSQKYLIFPDYFHMEIFFLPSYHLEVLVHITDSIKFCGCFLPLSMIFGKGLRRAAYYMILQKQLNKKNRGMKI